AIKLVLSSSLFEDGLRVQSIQNKTHVAPPVSQAAKSFNRSARNRCVVSLPREVLERTKARHRSTGPVWLESQAIITAAGARAPSLLLAIGVPEFLLLVARRICCRKWRVEQCLHALWSFLLNGFIVRRRFHWRPRLLCRFARKQQKSLAQ